MLLSLHLNHPIISLTQLFLLILSAALLSSFIRSYAHWREQSDQTHPGKGAYLSHISSPLMITALKFDLYHPQLSCSS